MKKETPKLWRVTRSPRSGVLQIRDQQNKCVVMFDWHKDRLADARLIAAAPDLLEALQEMIAHWNQGSFHPAVEQACTAIAKATGESSSPAGA